MGFPVCHSDPFLTNEAVQKASLGAVYVWKGMSFFYVQKVDAVATALGHTAEWADAAGTKVTNDKAGGSSLGRSAAAGGFLLPVTQNHFCFVQCGGVGTLLGDGSVAAGERVVSDAADGVADTMAAGEEHQVMALALADDDATTNLFPCRFMGLM